MADQKTTVTVAYIVNIKTRTVVKATAAVCVTILGCKVAGDIAAPFVENLANKLKVLNENPIVVAVPITTEDTTTVDK